MIQERAGKRNPWISFNDVNNLEVPFRGNTGRLEKNSTHSYKQESDTWLTEDAEKVEIFCNLHDCPREDVGIEVLEMEDHHHYPHTYNCLRVFKKKNTSVNKSGQRMWCMRETPRLHLPAFYKIPNQQRLYSTSQPKPIKTIKNLSPYIGYHPRVETQ